MFSTLADKEEKNRIRSLSPQAFENYVADIFKEKGFNVVVTPPTNDGGKDIVMNLNGKKFFVECKHYSDGAVGREAIQKLLGAGALERDVVGYFFVTSSYFNKNAIECGEKLNTLILLDLDDIISLKKIPANTFQNNINNHFSNFSDCPHSLKKLETFIVITDGLNDIHIDILKQTLGAELSIKYYFDKFTSFGILKNDYHTISLVATKDKISTHYHIRVSTKGRYQYISRFAHINNARTNRHLAEFTEFIKAITDEIKNSKYAVIDANVK